MSGALGRAPLREAGLACALLATVAAGARAQGPVTAAGAAIDYAFYRFTSPVPGAAKSVSMVAVPFAASAAIGHWLTLDASGAVARADVNLEGASRASLSGLTDTEVRATGRFGTAGTALAVSAVGLLPTGHARLSLTEAVVAGMVASNILPFRISNWGTGAGGIIDVSAVHALARGSVGLGASYRLAGSFRPFHAINVQYRPGNELRLRVAVDRAFENAHMLALQVAYSRFSEDAWGGIGLLRSGQRVLALGNYSAPVGSGVASVHAGVLHRSGGALSESIWLSGMLSGILAPPAETFVVLGSSARVPWEDRLLLPSLELRLLRHGNGAGNEMLVGVGGSAELPVGTSGVRLVPTARLRFGRLLLRRDEYSGVQGLELGLGVRFGGRE